MAAVVMTHSERLHCFFVAVHNNDIQAIRTMLHEVYLLWPSIPELILDLCTKLIPNVHLFDAQWLVCNIYIYIYIYNGVILVFLNPMNFFLFCTYLGYKC